MDLQSCSEQIIPFWNKTLIVLHHVTMDCGNTLPGFLVGSSHLQGQVMV
jgi:hypothetical protein